MPSHDFGRLFSFDFEELICDLLQAEWRTRLEILHRDEIQELIFVQTPTLSPAYDFLSTIPYMADETMALRYSRTKKMAEFSKDELKHLAAKAKLSEKLVLDTASETVARFKQVWSEQKTKLPLEKKVVGIVDAHAASIPIYSEL